MILGQEGILAPSSSPFAEDVVEAGQYFPATDVAVLRPVGT